MQETKHNSVPDPIRTDYMKLEEDSCIDVIDNKERALLIGVLCLNRAELSLNSVEFFLNFQI